MRKLFILWAPVLVAILLAGCSIPAPTCTLSQVVYPDGARLQGRSLQLGVIDAGRQFPFDLPAPLKSSAAQWAVLDDVRWGFIEPNAPQTRAHAYEWDNETAALDTRVHAYQQAGFELVIVLRAWNTWARAQAPQGGPAAAGASTPPKSEYMDDYAAWVQAVVERYDADGVDDYPGLVDVDGDGQPDPVRYYQIETEATNGVWWQGSDPATATDEYAQLLSAAATAARGAYPDVQILLAGLPALDLLDGFPNANDLRDVVENIDPAVCGAILSLQTLLARQSDYDIVAVHSVADYTGLETLAGWIATLAGKPVPVWLTGATTAPALTGDPQSLRVNPLFPTSGETLWAALQDASDPEHDKVESWYRAEQARLAFKKWVYAAWSGFDVVVMGLEQDRPEMESASLGRRDLAFQGMLDPANGFTPPDPRPVIPTLALAQAQLGGYAAVERIEGLPAGAHAFRFMVEGLPVYALWYDDGVAQGPDDAMPQVQVSLPVQASQLTLLRIPTRRGQSGPDVELLDAGNGAVTFTLDETPVILRGEWPSVYMPRVTR
ncbi:MAG: hypothetical protein GXP42_03470 [Chloroflexi bacterium]|nr:hypothetical protein [Chloroflexota bacterium]